MIESDEELVELMNSGDPEVNSNLLINFGPETFHSVFSELIEGYRKTTCESTNMIISYEGHGELEKLVKEIDNLARNFKTSIVHIDASEMNIEPEYTEFVRKYSRKETAYYILVLDDCNMPYQYINKYYFILEDGSLLKKDNNDILFILKDSGIKVSADVHFNSRIIRSYSSRDFSDIKVSKGFDISDLPMD